MSLRWATEEAALQLPWLSILKWWFLPVKWQIYREWACSQVWENSPYPYICIIVIIIMIMINYFL